MGIIAVAWVINRFGGEFLNAMGEPFTERRLLFKQVSAVLKFIVLIGTVTLVSVRSSSFSAELLLAVGGSVAVAVGFAFKDLLASLMAGIILLFDRPFQVGDRVEFSGQYGEVVEIGLRTVRMETLDDNLVSIPNNRFLSDVVSCANAGALAPDVRVPLLHRVQRGLPARQAGLLRGDRSEPLRLPGHADQGLHERGPGRQAGPSGSPSRSRSRPTSSTGATSRPSAPTSTSG